MGTFAKALSWTNSALVWLCAVWFGSAVVIGGILIAYDEWSFDRKKPELKEVKAYADRLEAEHGREALRVNGDASYQARLVKDFDRCRFLKAVSGELIRRAIAESKHE